MSDRTLKLQRWLNITGNFGLAEDGKFGPLTRSALIEVFRNRSAPAITEAEMQKVADYLGAPLRNLKAVAKVESAGGGWDDEGLLKCLWERHYLWRRVKVAVPFLSNPKPGGYTIDADRDNINDSWEKLADASGRFGIKFAGECASFGKFQIMGAHWKALGYAHVIDFVWQLSRTEWAHYDAFGRFVRVNNLIGALKWVDGNAENCRAFAKGYNGGAYEKHNYHGKIAAAWRGLG